MTEAPPPLRPLGLGEMLDRAVTLCVKHFVPLSAIYLVYAIPLAVVTFFATRNIQAVLQSLNAALAHGAAGGRASQAEVARALASVGGFDGWSAALLLLTLFVAPLPMAALIEATTSTYLGQPATFAEAYRIALGRWLPLIGVNVLYLAAGGVIYLVVVLAVIFVFFAVTLLTLTLHALGIAVAVVVGLILTIAGIAFAIVASLALQVSYFTCVVERANAAIAFTRGVSRVVAGVGLKRSLLIGAAFFAIAIAISVVSLAGQAVFVGLLRSAVAGTVYATILRIATAAFTTAFVGIFYFDLRVREEGLDLTLAAQSARASVLDAR